MGPFLSTEPSTDALSSRLTHTASLPDTPSGAPMSRSQHNPHLHSCYPVASSTELAEDRKGREASEWAFLHILTTEIPEQWANPPCFLQPMLLP